MSTAANLRAEAETERRAAADALRRADSARSLADDLERRYHALGRRLGPLIDRHRTEVWDSRAATASRMRLYISGTGTLGRARDDLLGIVGDLRQEAINLDDQAERHRRRAAAFEIEATAAAEAEALRASAAIPAPAPAPAPAHDLSFLAVPSSAPVAAGGRFQ